MLVSSNRELLRFAASFRNYGKPDYTVAGQNHRLSEFTAALGAIQVARLEEIVMWKNARARERLDRAYPKRVRFPGGMVSGLLVRSRSKQWGEWGGRVFRELRDLGVGDSPGVGGSGGCVSDRGMRAPEGIVVG